MSVRQACASKKTPGRKNSRLKERALLRFKPSSKGLVGVDISSTAVKLVELSRIGTQFQIENYTIEPLRHGAVVERRISDIDEVVSVLGAALDRVRPKTRQAVVMVPSSAAITKRLTLPAGLSDAEIEVRIQHDSDKHIPFPFSEVAFDFQRLAPGESSDGQQEILLVACRQQDVEQLSIILDRAGLVPAAVDVETFAIERAFALMPPLLAPAALDEAVALVDIGASQSVLHVLYDGSLIYSRDTAVGGQQLTETISERYGLTLEAAEMAKREESLPEDYPAQVLTPFIATLAEQVARSLQLYYTAGRPYVVKQMVLVGGSSAVRGLAEYLAKVCAMPVTVANPLEDMRSAARVDRQNLASTAPSLLGACGLAMRTPA